MNPHLVKVNAPHASCLNIARYAYSNRFPGIWHFHDEYEITYILESSGTRLIGDHIDQFSKGDFVLIGKNLPHTWQNQEASKKNPRALVLHFREDFLGKDFFNVPEMIKVRDLLKRSLVGLKITGETKLEAYRLFLEIEKNEGAEKIGKLLLLLHKLANSPELTELASEGFIQSFNHHDSERLNRVYEYVLNNFHEDISLKKVAKIANMTPTAFSRYFKNRTRKSFSRFLIEIKIGFACKLLLKEDKTVVHVCYESGFKNISNFNQQFKNITKVTPKKYQLMHITQVHAYTG